MIVRHIIIDNSDAERPNRIVLDGNELAQPAIDLLLEMRCPECSRMFSNDGDGFVCRKCGVGYSFFVMRSFCAGHLWKPEKRLPTPPRQPLFHLYEGPSGHASVDELIEMVEELKNKTGQIFEAHELPLLSFGWREVTAEEPPAK